MASRGGSLSFPFFLPIDMVQRLSASYVRAPVQSRVIPLSSDEGTGWGGCTESSGIAVDGLKSTSDVELMLRFREEGEEKEGEGTLRLEEGGFEGVWGCPKTDARFNRASRRAFIFNAL